MYVLSIINNVEPSTDNNNNNKFIQYNMFSTI